MHLVIITCNHALRRPWTPSSSHELSLFPFPGLFVFIPSVGKDVVKHLWTGLVVMPPPFPGDFVPFPGDFVPFPGDLVLLFFRQNEGACEGAWEVLGTEDGAPEMLGTEDGSWEVLGTEDGS